MVDTNFVSLYFFSLNGVILLCVCLDVFEHANISRDMTDSDNF